MMRRHGHPILGTIVGFLFFVFLGIDLMLFSVLRTDSNWFTIMALAGIVVGFLWGWWSPFHRGKKPTSAPATAPATPETVAAVAPAGSPPATEAWNAPTGSSDSSKAPPPA